MVKEIRKEIKTFCTQTMDRCCYSTAKKACGKEGERDSTAERLVERRAREIVMKSNEIIA